MFEGGDSSLARQRELWRLGAALADARLADRNLAIDNALERLATVLDVPAVGIWETQLGNRLTRMIHIWAEPDVADTLRDPSARMTNETVVSQMFENEGVATIPVRDLAQGREIQAGWDDGIGVLAIVDWIDGVALTVGVLTPQPSIGDDDVHFIRTFATTLRAFLARLRVEADLQARLDLGALVSDAVARLGAGTAETAGTIVAEVLTDLAAHLDQRTIRTYRVRPDRLKVHHDAGDSMDAVWDEVPRVPSRAVASGPTPTVSRLSALGDIFFDSTEGIDFEDDPTVTMFAADAGGSWREIVACIGPERQWTPMEHDAVAAITHAIVQLDARLEAERWSSYRHSVQAEISRLASRFLRATEHDVDEVVADALERVARQLRAPIAMMVGWPDESAVDRDAPVVTTVWSERETPFTVGEPVRFPGRWRPAHAGDATTGVFALGDHLDPAFRALMDADRQDRFSLVSVPVRGETGGPAALGLALPGSTRARFPMLTELLATFADLISQLRARLDLEAEKRRRQDIERFLHDVAVTLAEASDEDFDDAVGAVLAAAGRFLELDTLRVLRPDANIEAYTVRHQWGFVDDERRVVPYGVEEIVDRARTSGEAIVRHERLDADTTTSVVALHRGDEATSSIMVAHKIGAQLSSACCQVLDEVNRLLGQVELRIDAERYSQTAFGDSPIGIVMTDDRWRIVTCNRAFASFLGYDTPGDLVGLGPNDLLDTDARAPQGGTHDIPLRRKDGQRVWATSHSTGIQTAVSDTPMWLVHIEDITERRRAEQLLRFQATHDELTGLANRRRLHDVCEQLLDGGDSTAVILLDLDRFKLINDSLGHDRGDELLVVIADRLRLAIRPGDTVARLGGDEFAVVLAGPTDVYEAGRIADRLLRLLGEPVQLGSQTVYPSASLGVAVADGAATVSDLMRRADIAMYRAKAGGRGRHEAFDEDLRSEVQVRMETEAGLRRALRNHELVVHYQPEVSLRTGEILGAEALVRWQHPERGLLFPGDFIEVAEETGLVVDLGTHVLFEACRSAVTWPGDDLVVRVNFAAAQLQRPETVGLVSHALEQTGLPPHRLCVEITESAMMGDLEKAEMILGRLKELGVHVAVDDFGTGFSSLAYLKRFPVDALKIDREFVMVLGDRDEDNAFVRSIVSLADALGLSVVAEGVETRDQADMLMRLGCQRAQGFYFAKPGPVEDLLDRLGTRVTG
jgi:diguanylate cyclase (GGDEF)-like protein/PAS domain S-box-containing protein